MKNKLTIILSLIIVFISSCEDFLDRPALTSIEDADYWTSENNLRLFANGFYPNYFVGYNSSWGVDYAPLRGYYFSDDFSSSGKQGGFETQAPESRSSVYETGGWMTTYAGPSWNFSWVRKSNLFLERIEGMKDIYLTTVAYNHWSSVARFFRGFEYSRLVSVFGNVPYYDRVIKDNELDLLYKDRDERNLVMDKVYDDFTYVLDNMLQTDMAPQYLNKYIAASFISRMMLFEGTWQKYQLNDQTRAKKFLDLAVKASEIVMQSGKYSFTSDFRSLFGSEDLSGNKEVILYRAYDNLIGVMHHVASYSNLTESQAPASNLSLAKSFICNDGKPYKLSSLTNAGVLDIKNMVATRDSRFEATFWDAPRIQSSTLLYADKFIDRVGVTYYNKPPYPSRYGSNTNTNDAPVMRLAEVVLNWIEAKAELATIGGVPVTQGDLDASINAIRSRPLDVVSIGKGIVKTAPLTLANLPDDPDRDADVPALIWEIRRERRMEFVFEYSRLLDIKRWKKINYMDGASNPDILLGLWINFPTELPSWLVKSKEGLLKVKKADGTVVTYNGANKSSMVGYYIPEKVVNRDAFTERVYLAPVGNTQVNQYKDKGYNLTQTTGW